MSKIEFYGWMWTGTCDRCGKEYDYGEIYLFYYEDEGISYATCKQCMTLIEKIVYQDYLNRTRIFNIEEEIDDDIMKQWKITAMQRGDIKTYNWLKKIERVQHKQPANRGKKPSFLKRR